MGIVFDDAVPDVLFVEDQLPSGLEQEHHIAHMPFGQRGAEGRVVYRFVTRHRYLYALKLHKEIGHLSLDGLEVEPFLLNERAVEVDTLSEAAVHPTFVSVERHEVSAGEGSCAVYAELLYRHMDGVEAFRVCSCHRTTDH